MTKEEYIEFEVEEAFNNHKFVVSVLRDYYANIVEDMTEAEFKDHLIEYGYID